MPESPPLNLPEILASHARWLAGDPSGQRANLVNADLRGWLIHQAGEVGRLLEAAVGSSVAGLMLGGVEAHSHFYDSNEAATEFLRSVLALPEVKA